MIKSMTGYGSAKGEAEGQQISIEIKSINNRYFDCSVRMPRIYMFAEDGIKKQIKKGISRGKVDVFINIDSSEARDVKIEVNTLLAKAYYDVINSISAEVNVPSGVNALEISRLPDVLNIKRQETDADKFSEGLMKILDQALAGFDSMRTTEGGKLQEDICGRLVTIEAITAEIEIRSPESVKEYREGLEQRMAEILKDGNIEESRIITEAAIFADKVAIDEEITRLQSHVSQIKELMNGQGAAGRKLDFLLQELNREVNTIGSKANDTDISKLVIELKAEIEKIREQAQNIE